MSRPRKKPDYNAKDIMNELLTDVTEYYTSSPKISLCNVANEFDITLLKARKLLITAGVYATEISDEVQQLREDGKTIPEIMNLTGLSRASVHSYLPYKKGIYNAKESSLDADRCRIYRQRKAAVERLQDDPDYIELLWNAIQLFADYPFQTCSKGLRFRYEVKGNEIFVSRKKKSITKATVILAYQRMREGDNIQKAKDLGTFGASYLYPIFQRFGVGTDLCNVLKIND